MTAAAVPLPGAPPDAPSGWAALGHPVAWLKAHPYAADALLAVVVAALPVAMWVAGVDDDGVAWRPPDAGLAVCIALTSVPLVWRRSRPLLVLGLTLAAAALLGMREYNPNHLLGGDIVMLYTVAAHCSKRTSRLVLLGWVVVLGPLMLWAPVPEGGRTPVGDVAMAYLLFGIVWLVGDNLQARRANVAALHERAERAERDRAEEARRAVEAERSRIAREMHDVVAHSMSVMVVQATGARRVVARDPARAEEALGLIETTGREGLQEMRRLLGILREDTGPTGPDRGPQPTLDDIDVLVAECEATGLPVTVRREGAGGPLAPGVDLAAYRIVQEALTNVRRHAGPTATAEVAVTHSPDAVAVEVADDGRGPSADRTGDGHGIVGMQERAALYGGEVTAGPRPGGGFVVRARLPRDAT